MLTWARLAESSKSLHLVVDFPAAGSTTC
jgi:hypothetical protein